MKALITGATGFAGRHLAHYLSQQTDIEPHATCLEEPGSLDTGIQQRFGSITQLDVRDYDAMYHVLARLRPEMIVHLAAQTYVPAARKDPWPTFEINIRGTINVLESMKALNLRQSRVLIVGSSEAYGFVRADDLPLDENQPFNPGANPYSVSKIAQDMLGLQYFQSDGLTVLRARPFNHIGPGQQPIFVAPNFATQIAEIEAGLKPPVLRVGNLAAERDFSDVRDVVRAYHLILTRGEPGAVYNICSGRALSIQRLVDILIGYARRDITVEVDPERVRPVDVPRVVGDFSALQQATGWQPAYTIEDTLRDVLDDCRQQVAARHQSG